MSLAFEEWSDPKSRGREVVGSAMAFNGKQQIQENPSKLLLAGEKGPPKSSRLLAAVCCWLSAAVFVDAVVVIN